MYHTKIIPPSGDIADALAIRDAVFTVEQGFAQPDLDENDPLAYHVVIYDGENAVATGRTFRYRDTLFKPGRIAVLKAYRGKNLGRMLMDELERISLEQGAASLTLGAQLYAVPFYEKCGFIPTGEQYMEEFCAHETMIKALQSNQ